MKKYSIILTGLLAYIGASTILSAKDMIIASSCDCQLAEFSKSELATNLNKLYSDTKFETTKNIDEAHIILMLAKDAKGIADLPSTKGSFNVLQKDGKLYVIGFDKEGLLNATYALLNKLGCGFYISGDSFEGGKKFNSLADFELKDAPLVGDRIMFTWHNFLSGCTGWNLEDWKSWVLQSRKMGYNAIMIHAYANNPMFSFSYLGQKKQIGYFANSSYGRDWGNQHINDVRRMVAGDMFDDAIFGAEVTKRVDKREELTVDMMQEVFDYAKKLSTKIIFAYDFDTWIATPQNIVKQLPKESLLKVDSYFIPNPETEAGYKYYKAQLEHLLKLYPQIDNLSITHRSPGEGFGTIWMKFPKENFPKHWQKEYAKKLEQNPLIKDDLKSSAMFAYSKLIECIIKIRNEIKPDLELSSFSWRFEYVPLADVFFPKEITLLPLDHKVHYSSTYAEKIIKDTTKNRNLYPIVWAHHDDHRYLGRPYTPWSNFASSLEDRNCKGFGVIHWTTRPLDLYMLNTINQVWQSSKDEPVDVTIDKYVHRNFVEQNQKPMAEYLSEWIKKGPMFGRETTDHFLDLGREPTWSKDNTWAIIEQRAKQRIKILDKTIKSTDEKVVDYYKGMEDFYLSLAQNQMLFNSAYKSANDGNIDEAIEAISKTNPEKTIQIYADAIQKYNTTHGERGIVFSMNARLLPDYLNLKQRLGIMPVRFKYNPTQHDPLAQAAGKYSYFIDESKVWLRCQWKNEIKKAKFDIVHSTPARVVNGSDEIYLTTIHGDKIPSGLYEFNIKAIGLKDLSGISFSIISKESKDIVNIEKPSLKSGVISFKAKLKPDDKLVIKTQNNLLLVSLEYCMIKGTSHNWF